MDMKNWKELPANELVIRTAHKYGWQFHENTDYRVRFKKDKSLIDVYWNGKGRLTKICTIINHPKRGRGQMFRPLRSNQDMEQYFKNPRVHTGDGYGANKRSNGEAR